MTGRYRQGDITITKYRKLKLQEFEWYGATLDIKRRLMLGYIFKFQCNSIHLV